MYHPSNGISLQTTGSLEDEVASNLPEADGAVGMERKTKKFVALLNHEHRGRYVRSTMCLVWLVLTVAGGLLMKSFKDKLETDVPPSKGTPSYDAQKMNDYYFPGPPITGALLAKSTDHTPFLNWGNSTCELPPWIPSFSGCIRNSTEIMNCLNSKDGVMLCLANLYFSGNITTLVKCVKENVPIKDKTLIVKLECRGGDKELGNGCITKNDATAQLALVLLFLRGVDPDKYASVSGMIDLLPAECPLRSERSKDWLQFDSDVRTDVNSKFGNYNHTVTSFESVPDISNSMNVNLSKYAQYLQPIGLDVDYVNLSVFVPAGTLWGLLRDKLLADDDTTSLTAITVSSKNGGEKINPTGEEAKKIGADLAEIAKVGPSTLSAQASSLGFIFEAVQKGIDAAMNYSALTTPVALLILAAMVRNLRLLLLTIVNLVVSILAAILVMYPYVLSVTTSTVTPALMIAVALAMSIDYSLFLLRRFSKEIAMGRDVPEAVAIMLATSGRIIITSGVTLLLCFLAMLTLPVAFIFSMGVAAAVTVFMAVVVALTVTPIMLLSFPTFFSSNKYWGLTGDGCCRGPRELDRFDGQGNTSPRKSCWVGFGTQIQRAAIVVALSLLVGMIPVAITSLPRFDHSVGVITMMPTTDQATHTVKDLQQAFGVGSVFPTTLIVVPSTNVSDATKRATWLNQSCLALQQLATFVDKDLKDKGYHLDHDFTAAAFSGAMILNGHCLTSGVTLMKGMGAWSNEGHPYSATTVSISYPIDPFSVEGGAWIEALRHGTQQKSSTDVAKWYVYGTGPTQMDVANITFSRLPLMVGVMMAIVFIVIAVSFKSVVAPVRAVFCLAWMLVITFGLAIYTFQDGMLDFLGASQVGSRGSMSWMSPSIAIPVMVGLGLDYDIFYTERVIEEWIHGYGEKVAASRALGDTANTISAAGVIMVVAFCSLLICHIPVLNEISFLLIVGIVIDCFITTKIIIPCAMALLGRWNFWPRKHSGKERSSSGGMSTGLVSEA